MNWTQLTLNQNDNCFYNNGEKCLGPYKGAMKFHSPGLAPVKDETGWFHINQDGISVYHERYLKAFGFYFNRAAVCDPIGWFHIDTYGTPAYAGQFNWAGNYQQGICTVQLANGKYQHINLDGVPLNGKEWDYAGDFYDDVAAVKGSGQYFHITRTGELLYPESGLTFLYLGSYHKGYAIAKDEKGWFHINIHGLPIYAERYSFIEPFYNENALAFGLGGEMMVLKLGEILR